MVLLGPSGGGKSTVVTLLSSALNCAHRDYYGDVTNAKRLSLNASLTLPGSLSEVYINLTLIDEIECLCES